MRRLLLALFLCACDPGIELAAPGTVCAEAQDHFLDCGVALGILSGDRCHGAGRLVAECVVERVGSCERLANITYDQCVIEAGERAAEVGDDGLLPIDPVDLLPSRKEGDD